MMMTWLGNLNRSMLRAMHRPLSRRLDRCDRVIQNESKDPFGGNVYYVTMQITFLTRKIRNGERYLHCDIVHITTKWVSSLTLDCNGVFAIKAYWYESFICVQKPSECLCLNRIAPHCTQVRYGAITARNRCENYVLPTTMFFFEKLPFCLEIAVPVL